MAALLERKAKELEQKRGELKTLLDSKKTAGGEYTHSKDDILAIRDRHKEIEELAGEIKGLREIAAIDSANADGLKDLERPVDNLALPTGVEAMARNAKSFGKRFIEAKGHTKQMRTNEIVMEDISVKTLFQTTDGFQPEVVRNRPILLSAQRPMKVVDVMPTRETTQPGIKYMEETVVNNAATEIGEGGDYPEAELQFEEKSSPVQKIAVFIPVTEEQLEDVAYIEGYLNDRLPWMLRQRLDIQLVRGDGAGNNLRGLRNNANAQTQATGADPLFDAIHKGITKIQVNAFGDPDLGILHPNDWQNIRLTRTTEGLYILGNPDQQVSMNLWGLPIVTTVAAVEGEGIIADTQFLELSPYKSVEVLTSNSHSDYFTKGKLAVRARIRVGFTMYRGQTICLVTGLNG